MTATGAGDRWVIATRGSPLARIQASEVATLLGRVRPSADMVVESISTKGDRLASVSLDRIGGQGVFVKEIQVAVLDGRARFAVHSAKDLPPRPPDGLVLGAVPVRADPRDALLGRPLDTLSPGSVVATGSPRRRAQLANLRPDIVFRELRGNMDTRRRHVEQGRVDALLTAVAACERLGWSDQMAQIFSPTEVLPQAGQGAIAVECRADDTEARRILAEIDDVMIHRCVDAERAFLDAMGGSCAVPIAALGVPDALGLTPGEGEAGKAELSLEAMLASGDGRIVVRARGTGTDPIALGNSVARSLLTERGGGAIEGVVLTTDGVGLTTGAP